MKISHLLQESIILEDSTALPLVQGSPNSVELVKKMHSRLNLDPKQKFEQVPKLNWREIKNGPDGLSWVEKRNYRGTWVILAFKEGAAGIFYDPSAGTYSVIANNVADGEIAEESFSTSKGALNFIKNSLGMKKLLSSKANIYMGPYTETAKVVGAGWRGDSLEDQPGRYGQWSKEVGSQGAVPSRTQADVKMHDVTTRKLANIRKERQKQTAALTQSNPEKLLKRFKPLWLRAAKAALADVGGIVQTMAKTGAYDRLKHKIEKNISPLENIINSLESGDDLQARNRYSYYGNTGFNYLLKAIKRAVALTSVYYYPDRTGNVNQDGTPDNPEGVATLMSDIDSGDMKKFKTVLDYFKQEMMRA